MKCFQCVHWVDSLHKCSRMELKVKPRTLYTHGGYPWKCEFCRSAHTYDPNPLYGKCPLLAAERKSTELGEEDAGLNHPKCPKSNANRSRGRFCDFAVVRHRFMEYPMPDMTDANACGISEFSDYSEEVAKQTLESRVYVGQISCVKPLVELLISRGYPLTKSGYVRAGAEELTLGDLIRNLGDAEMRLLAATPRTGKRLTRSIAELMEGFDVSLFRPSLAKPNDEWRYWCGHRILSDKIAEIRKEAEAGK